MINGNPGEFGQYLFSNGSGTLPVWKNLLPENSKQLFDAFSVLGVQDETIIHSSDNWHKIELSDVVLSGDEYGSFESNVFTVSKPVLYFISVSIIMFTNTTQIYGLGKMRIVTTPKTVQFNGLSTQLATTPIVYNQNSSGEIVIRLNEGDQIWMEGYCPANWTLSRASLFIKYSNPI